MNKSVVFIVVILLLVGGYVLVQNSRPQVQPAESDVVQPTEVETSEDESTGSMGATASSTPDQSTTRSDKKSFTVEGSSFEFSPKVLNVKKGDTVEIVFKNLDGMHDWVVDEFDAKTKVIKGGETETISFVVDTVGTFEFYCSVGQHRANGMVGKLVVTE